MSAPLHPVLRQLALAAGLLAVCWLLSQGVVLAWGVADAQLASIRRGSGEPWRQWRFVDPDSIIVAGSSGLQGARHEDTGLALPAAAGAVDLSLPLAGQRLPAGTTFVAELWLDSRAAIEVQLLGAIEGGDATVLAGADVDGPAHLRWQFTTASAADVLRLRVHRAEPASVVLQTLGLDRPSHCDGASAATAPGCRHWHRTIALDWAATPERMLAQRDLARARWPLAEPALRPVRAGIAQAAAWARRDAPLPMLALLAAIGVLAWSVHARRRERPATARQLLPLLTVPVLLLACGWPRDQSSAPAAAAFAVSLLACFLHPGGRGTWRWVGGWPAWRQAALIAAAGAAVLVLIATASSGDWTRPPSLERTLRYLPWAMLQQALLLLVIAPRLQGEPKLSGATACWLSGAVFALLHLPNFGLMVATLGAGAVFAWAGRRQPALLPLVAVHWLLGTLLAWLATPWLLRNAEVGGRYLMAAG